MTLGLAFYVILLVWAIFGALVWTGNGGPYAAHGNTLLLFVLFLLLGWKVFGPPLHG